MNPNKRLLSLDILRGITVAGMILVNNTGTYNFAMCNTCQMGTVSRQPIWFFPCLCF